MHMVGRSLRGAMIYVGMFHNHNLFRHVPLLTGAHATCLLMQVIKSRVQGGVRVCECARYGGKSRAGSRMASFTTPLFTSVG